MHTDLLPHHHGEEEHHNIDQIRAQLAKADNFQIVADIFKQVGDPTRVRIFWLLCHCEECVQNISALMEMSSPAVSHHLRGLKDNGLIVSRRVGKEVFYKAADTDQSRLLHIMIEKVMAKRYLMNQKQAGAESFWDFTLDTDGEEQAISPKDRFYKLYSRGRSVIFIRSNTVRPF